MFNVTNRQPLIPSPTGVNLRRLAAMHTQQLIPLGSVPFIAYIHDLTPVGFNLTKFTLAAFEGDHWTT